MRVVWLRVRLAVRRAWWSELAVVLVVVLASGTVLSLAAGARRTADAPDAYTRSVGGDIDATVQQQSGPPRTAEVRALPGIRSVAGVTFVFGEFVDAPSSAESQTLMFAGTPLHANRLVAGRLARRNAPKEFVADTAFVREHHARLGSTFKVVTWSADQAAHGQAYVGPPEGPSFEATLVGIVNTADVLQDGLHIAVFSLALLRQDVGTVATVMSVRLDAGTTPSQLRAALDKLPSGSTLSIHPGRVVSAEVRNAVDAQARGLALMALVAAIASLVVLGQLLSRHVRLTDEERRALEALGITRAQITGETVLRATLSATIGVSLGGLLAAWASSRFPAGFVRMLEPSPGPRFDAQVLILGGVALVMGMVLWVAAAWILGPRRRGRLARAVLAESVTRRAPSPSAATGTGFALGGTRGSTSSALGSVSVIVVIIGGLVAAATFAVSLNRLVAEPARFGGNYTFAVGDLSDLSAPDLRAAFEGDRDIAGLMIISEAEARAGEATVALDGLTYVHGELAPVVLQGRLPTRPDEVAFGRIAARDLGIGVGSPVPLAGPDGRGSFTVVGLVVVPSIGGNDGVGQGGVMTAEGLGRLVQRPEVSMAAVQLRPDAPSGARDRIGKIIGAPTGEQSVPSSILNVARVRSIPTQLAGLLALLVVLMTLHTTIVSVRGHRRDLATLRALGADQRWIARAVRWQATALIVIPFVLGLPLGLVVGRALFRAFGDRIGAVSDPTLPLLVSMELLIGLVALAILTAAMPVRRARRVAPARVLAQE